MARACLAQGPALLLAALGFARLELQPEPALAALTFWLGGWHGVGLVTEAMLRQDFDLALTHDESGWRASFLHRDHLTRPWVGQILSWWPTPSWAVQEAAWKALNAAATCDVSLTEESPP
jgi:hypothetical protein